MEFEQLNIFGRNKKICSKKTKAKKLDFKNNKIKELYCLYNQLYEILNIPLFEQKEIVVINNIIAYPEYREAEINGTQLLSIDERIKIHRKWLENNV